MEDQEPRDADDGDELEATIMQADRAFAAESVGTTAEEGLEGESLEPATAEERPDRPTRRRNPLSRQERCFRRRGRARRRRGDPTGRVHLAEEAAMSVRDSAPGATKDHDDPHPRAELASLEGFFSRSLTNS